MCATSATNVAQNVAQLRPIILHHTFFLGTGFTFTSISPPVQSAQTRPRSARSHPRSGNAPARSGNESARSSSSSFRCLKVRHFYVCASSASNEAQVRHQKEGSHIPHPFLLWSGITLWRSVVCSVQSGLASILSSKVLKVLNPQSSVFWFSLLQTSHF